MIDTGIAIPSYPFMCFITGNVFKILNTPIRSYTTAILAFCMITARRVIPRNKIWTLSANLPSNVIDTAIRSYATTDALTSWIFALQLVWARIWAVIISITCTLTC